MRLDDHPLLQRVTVAMAREIEGQLNWPNVIVGHAVAGRLTFGGIDLRELARVAIEESKR